MKTKFVKTVIDFAIAITGKDGRRHDYGDFSFRVTVTKNSILGGITVEIWYRLGKRDAGVVPPVLKAWWQFEVEKCQITTFDCDRQWQGNLREAIGRRKEIVAHVHRRTGKERTKYVEEMYQLHLAEKARREAKVRQQCEELLERFRERARC